MRLRLGYDRRVIVYLGAPKKGLKIGGKSAADLVREAPDPGRVLVAERLREVGWCLGHCLGTVSRSP